MSRVPDDFRETFDEKGETFFEIAELLYTRPDRQYTQEQLAEEVDRSKQTISVHTREMDDEGWLVRKEDQTTFSWNSEAHNPASTEGITAVRIFYRDLWELLLKHSSTTPGAIALVGFAMLLTSAVLFSFFIGFSLGITKEPALPPVIFLVIALGTFLTGFVATFYSPVHALLNRLVSPLIPKSVFQRGK